MTNEEMKAYKLGTFAADFLIHKGAIQPDFQLENVGERNGIYTFVDFADVEIFDLPRNLTTDVVRKIKESILSLTENYEGDFSLQSYVRAGFVSRAGLLGHMVYEDARDNNYSSFLFLNKPMVSAEHSLYRITKWTNVKKDIGEWFEFFWHIEQGASGIENLSVVNKFYFNMLSLMESLIEVKAGQSEVQEVEIVLQIAIQAFKFGMPYLSYGLADRVNTMDSAEIFSKITNTIITNTKDEVSQFKKEIDNRSALDIVELMWYLEDLDITVPEKCS